CSLTCVAAIDIACPRHTPMISVRREAQIPHGKTTQACARETTKTRPAGASTSGYSQSAASAPSTATSIWRVALSTVFVAKASLGTAVLQGNNGLSVPHKRAYLTARTGRLAAIA